MYGRDGGIPATAAEPCESYPFVDEDVAAPTVVDERPRGRGVARNHDDAVGRIEPEAEGINHVFVLRGECRNAAPPMISRPRERIR